MSARIVRSTTCCGVYELTDPSLWEGNRSKDIPIIKGILEGERPYNEEYFLPNSCIVLYYGINTVFRDVLEGIGFVFQYEFYNYNTDNRVYCLKYEVSNG